MIFMLFIWWLAFNFFPGSSQMYFLLFKSGENGWPEENLVWENWLFVDSISHGMSVQVLLKSIPIKILLCEVNVTLY